MSEPIEFAISELLRCLESAGMPASVGDGAGPHFRVGLAQDVGVAVSPEPSPCEDWICIDASENGGTLAGSNPRSVLFAVYRYLRELGFAWPRPEPGAELVPDLAGGLGPVHLQEAASYPIRTLCIEGACALEHVVALIDWATKHGLNGYFLQFECGTEFWRKWYAAVGNPHR